MQGFNPIPYDQLSDEELLALCLYREAEGESYLGKRAVAHVIDNRAKNMDNSGDWPHSIKGVILQHRAFSSFNLENPRAHVWLDYSPSCQDCLEIADMVIRGMDADLTNGAVYYANLQQISAGAWFDRVIVKQPDKHPQTIQIGKHTFFR